MASSDIPIIDLSTLGSRAGAEHVAAQVGAACTEIGFFAIANHGVSQSVVDELARVAQAFFDLDHEERMALAIDGTRTLTPGLPQYFPLEEEALAATLGRATPGDLKHSLGVGPMDAGRPWPREPVGLERAFAGYRGEMRRLTKTLRGLCALALDLPTDYFEPFFARESSYLRVIDYPECGDALPGQLRAGEHTDYDFLTILRSQDSAGGLQVRGRAGDWIDVQGVDGAFVVNIGDMTARWTNDRWVSTPHRVLTPPHAELAGSRRQSIAFFHTPDYDATISCIPTCLGDGEEPRYAPVRYRDYQDEKTALAHAAR